MNLYVQTLGCKVNAVESAGIAALFAAQGFTVCEDPALADVILLNSCTVTASGDSRMRRALRQLRAAAPDAVLILTGCYAQAFPEDAAALPEPDIVTGTADRDRLPALAATGTVPTASSPMPVGGAVPCRSRNCKRHCIPCGRRALRRSCCAALTLRATDRRRGIPLRMRYSSVQRRGFPASVLVLWSRTG